MRSADVIEQCLLSGATRKTSAHIEFFSVCPRTGALSTQAASNGNRQDSNFTAIEYDHISLSPRSAPWSLCFTMSSSICSVLLDLDGTLIDSQPGILASC